MPLGRFGILIWFILLLAAGCSTQELTMRKDQESNVFPNKIPLASYRVMQVLDVGPTDVLTDPERYARFIHNATGFISPYWNATNESRALHSELSSALPAAQVAAGLLVVGRVYCCGGVQETVTRQYAFSPAALPVRKNDFVEVRFADDTPAAVNTVTRIVSQCGWVPRDPRSWVRIPYCAWMKEEAWTEVSSMLTASHHAWLKAAARPPAAPGASPATSGQP